MADKISDLLKRLDALYPVVKNTDDLNPWDKMVQFEDDANKVASGDTTIAFSGPPIFRKGGNTTIDIATWEQFLVPIGALQGFSDNSTNNVVPFPEIGSRLKRAARGQASYQLSIQRVLTYHSNIMHACYAWLKNMTNTAGGVDLHRFPSEKKRPTDSGSTSPHFTTFESELFGVPFGLLLATLTADGTVMCQEYYERCYLLNHGKQVGAGQPMIQEAVSIMASRKVPADDLTLSMEATALSTYNWPDPDAGTTTTAI
jgi:hypothetical protein